MPGDELLRACCSDGPSCACGLLHCCTSPLSGGLRPLPAMTGAWLDGLVAAREPRCLRIDGMGGLRAAVRASGVVCGEGPPGLGWL
jgi:hypothetical protein